MTLIPLLEWFLLLQHFERALCLFILPYILRRWHFFSFLRVLGLGTAIKACIFYGASQTFTITDGGAFQGPDDTGGHIPLVVFSSRKDIIHESTDDTVCSGILVVLVVESSFHESTWVGFLQQNGWTTRALSRFLGEMLWYQTSNQKEEETRWYESQGFQPTRDRRDECQFERSILKPSSHFARNVAYDFSESKWEDYRLRKASNA